MADKSTPTTQADVSAELETLKQDLMALREDLGRASSAAVDQGKQRAAAARDSATDSLEQSLASAEGYVRDRPLSSSLVAFGAGVLLGTLLAKK